jgi:hypothetical protein
VAVGCNVELTRVAFGPEPNVWWTLGFEAFGDLSSAPPALKSVVDAIRPPAPVGGIELSYPAWIDIVSA